MIVSLPGAALTGIALFFLYRAGYRGFWIVTLAVLFGFFLASTGVAPSISAFLTGCAHVIGQICSALTR
ncbi:hypothetical protein [Streptacidiphilus anmyonensis]|uniref:hypothetical protein n=1 Tax=Streptacidiphilus anmyonensis TaxID=405782 RepID=UPI0005AAF4BD|nr:hypothetical protein [Streptacidiphilus anmyonensis]